MIVERDPDFFGACALVEEFEHEAKSLEEGGFVQVEIITFVLLEVSQKIVYLYVIGCPGFQGDRFHVCCRFVECKMKKFCEIV